AARQFAQHRCLQRPARDGGPRASAETERLAAGPAGQFRLPRGGVNMAKWGMAFDLRRCIGRHHCAIACKQENTLPTGVFFTKTLSETVGTYPNVSKVYVPTICNHCEDAPCERVCPTGATYTRPDGIVMVDSKKCIGCGSCIVACPYDA